MSYITCETITIPGTPVGPESELPLLHFPIGSASGNQLPENEGLFLNYGSVQGALPYSERSAYNRAAPGEKTTLQTVVLENARLRAVFLPEVGGRLWSLTDKLTGRDLVVANTAFQPCNFAIRNAWVSGGIEWNCGVRGHSALTCEKVFVAPYTMSDGNTAVRIYAFERFRAIAYQLDCFLRDDLPFLFVRVRIENASDEVKPIYWWSTTAVKQEEGARVIVPADSTYVNQGTRPLRILRPLSVKGRDLTYPANHVESVDHFYRIPKDARKYEAYVFDDGNGLIQASTRRLKGRKLFVWGVSAGGQNWQKFLTNSAGYDQPYAEIQAGLAATQNESLPMPPQTAWEWLEAYGPIQLEAARAHGSWREAKNAAEDWLEQHIPEKTLDALLKNTREDAKTSVTPRFHGDGWGALENILRLAQGKKQIAPHLEWGEPQKEQAVWLALLQNGTLPDEQAGDVLSYMVQNEWFHLLKQSVARGGGSGWRTQYHIGLCYYARELYEEACDAFTRSLASKITKHALHGHAYAKRAMGNAQEAASLLKEAHEIDPADQQLAKEAFRAMLEAKQYDALIRGYQELPEHMRKVPMIWAIAAAAYAFLGEYETAQCMMTNSKLQPPDLREGDVFIIDAYVQNRIAIAKQQGVKLEIEEVEIPDWLDFRMF